MSDDRARALRVVMEQAAINPSLGNMRTVSRMATASRGMRTEVARHVSKDQVRSAKRSRLEEIARHLARSTSTRKYPDIAIQPGWDETRSNNRFNLIKNTWNFFNVEFTATITFQNKSSKMNKLECRLNKYREHLMWKPIGSFTTTKTGDIIPKIYDLVYSNSTSRHRSKEVLKFIHILWYCIPRVVYINNLANTALHQSLSKKKLFFPELTEALEIGHALGNFDLAPSVQGALIHDCKNIQHSVEDKDLDYSLVVDILESTPQDVMGRLMEDINKHLPMQGSRVRKTSVWDRMKHSAQKIVSTRPSKQR